MHSSSEDDAIPVALPVRRQVAVVAGLALGAVVLVAALMLYPAGESVGATPPDAAKPSGFMPTKQQARSLKIQPVALRAFRTEIVTDGYVTPNGGFGASARGGAAERGLPVLSGQSADVLQAETDLMTASAQVRLAQTVELRQRELYRSEGASLKDWQQSQAELATAQAALGSARSRLRILGRSDMAIAAAESGSSRAVRDPMAGAAFSVSDFSTLWLVANVREADAGSVRLGDPVMVRVPAYPNQVFRAVVGYVASVIDPGTHRLAVGAQVRNEGNELKPNMQATVTISSGDAAEAPAVPDGAIIYEADTARVWVAQADGSLHLRNISVGRNNGGYVEVVKGLAAGERIVTSGALFIDRAGAG